jgi:hypothetical protein
MDKSFNGYVKEERWKRSRVQELMPGISNEEVCRYYGYSFSGVGSFNMNLLRHRIASNRAFLEYEEFAKDWDVPFNDATNG